MFWKQIQYSLTKFAVKAAILLGAPLAIGWYFLNRGREEEVIIGAAVYALLVILYLVYRLLWWMFGKKPQTVAEKYHDVLSFIRQMRVERFRLGVGKDNVCFHGYPEPRSTLTRAW